MKAPALATNKRNKATSIIILSLLQWEDHIDFGKNFGPRWPLINRSDKKNDDCGICAAPYQRFSSALGYSLHVSYLPSFANDAAETSLAPCRSRITCKRYLAPPRGATLERRGALTQTSRLLLWLRPIRFFFSVCAVANFAPISSPLTQASSQRRYVRPVDDSRRKNSLSFKPSIESRMLSLAPVSDTSCITQSRRQVPSIAMIETSIPFSKTTLTPLRRSEVATLCTHLNCSRKLPVSA